MSKLKISLKSLGRADIPISSYDQLVSEAKQAMKMFGNIECMVIDNEDKKILSERHFDEAMADAKKFGKTAIYFMV